MNRPIVTAALLGFAFAIAAPTHGASAAGVAAPGALKAAAEQVPAAEAATPVHYWGYRRYRPYYGYGGYYRPHYGYRSYGYGYRPYYGYGYGRSYGYGYRYRW